MSFDVERFKALRKSKDLTQWDLAKKLHLTRATIAMWETGRNQPTLEILSQLADILGCSADYLLSRTDATSANYPDDPWTLREDEREDPDRKRLFMLARHGSAQDIRQASALIDALRATNPDFYDGDDPA